jgi:hypothetical protein
VKANDHLALLSDGPRLDRKQWRAKPSLAPKLQLVLDRIKSLTAGGLTSMHVVGDFLKRRITPLQQRARLCLWFTGSNDIGRVQCGPGTDLTWEALEVLVKGITGESFVVESLILPEGISALCDDAGLRTVILATLPTLDESGMAVRQTGGRDPHRGIQISDAPARGPQSAGVAPSAPARASHASAAAPPPFRQGQRGCKQLLRPRWRRGVGGREATLATPRRQIVHFGPPIRVEEADSHKHQRTAGGTEETDSQAQGAQRRVSPSPPQPSGPPPPQPPPPLGSPPPTAPGHDFPQGHQQKQQQQQQQQKQRSPRFQGRWKIQAPK